MHIVAVLAMLQAAMVSQTWPRKGLLWQKQPRDKSISGPGATDPNIGLEFARRHLKVVAARIWGKLQEALLDH